jgi:hypothetical protein
MTATNNYIGAMNSHVYSHYINSGRAKPSQQEAGKCLVGIWDKGIVENFLENLWELMPMIEAMGW